MRPLVCSDVSHNLMLPSKTLAPTYEKLADSYQHLKKKVVIAKVDADAHKELGQRFGVTGIFTDFSF